ncbi:MAG: MG2 domain-containing protein, partial [Proteobacteria bacterium]|nr:MG2 domain-containing protein [Pseudomonadota bacterium]
MPRSLWCFPFTLSLVLGCGSSPPPTTQPSTPATTKTDATIAALAPSKLAPSAAIRSIDAAIAAHYGRASTRRAYVMTDKPLYQPGETIWFRADLRATGSLVGVQQGLRAQLISPRGATVFDKRILAQGGVGQNDFALPAEIEGGEYTIQLTADDGTLQTKRIIVNTYEAPRLKKTVELLRKAYGAGDQVTAAIDVKRATGEPLADRALTGVLTVDDVEIARVAITTDKDGKATARFQLPAQIARGDGLFTVLVDDGGVTESIQK